MDHKNRKTIIACGSAVALTIAVIAVRSITATLTSGSEGLESLSISPSGDVNVMVGESIRLTAEGDYGTRSMPVRADWSLVTGEDLGELEACSNAQACTFTAGESAGTATIQAQTGDGTFMDTVDVVVESKKEELVNPFKDELPEWAFEAIVRMHMKGIIKGYDDGRYGPGDPVTNGQVITLIHRILLHANLTEDPVGCDQVYDDVPPKHYAFIPACTFRRQGWSSEEDRFYPDEASPRGVTAAFMNSTVGETLLKAMGSRPSQGQVFDDVPLDHSHFGDTAVTNHTGLMTGYPNGDFGVADDLNRAAVAVVMFRILNKIEELDIAILEGYDPGATGGHGAAPRLATAACSIMKDNINSPDAHADAIGDGYAKFHLYDSLKDVWELRARCTDEIFGELMEEYCARDGNSDYGVRWGVLMFNADGSIRLGGSADGPNGTRNEKRICSNHPDAGAELPKAVCVVHTSNHGSWKAQDPEVGEGYAKYHINEELDLSALRARCERSVYEDLMDRLCVSQDAGTPVYWGVLMYAADGTTKLGGGSGLGNDTHHCL